MAKTLIGLDLGSSEIKFAVRNGKNARFEVERLPEETVTGGHVQLSEIKKSFLKQAKRRCRVPSGECCVVLPEQQVFCRLITMPYIPEKQLLLNLPYEFRDYIAQDSAGYYYDYAVERVVADADGKPASLELMAAAVSKSVIAAYSELLSSTGLRLKTAVPREMAYVYLLRAYEKAVPEHPDAYCLADIGLESTRVYFFESSRLSASRNVPIGCRDIDLAIAEQKHVDEYVASSYKFTNFEDVLDSPDCRAVYARLSIEIMKAVNFYRFRNDGSSLSGIYFLGGGANIAQLREQIAEDVTLEQHDFSELLTIPASGSSVLTAALAYGAAEGGLQP